MRTQDEEKPPANIAKITPRPIEGTEGTTIIEKGRRMIELEDTSYSK